MLSNQDVFCTLPELVFLHYRSSQGDAGHGSGAGKLCRLSLSLVFSASIGGFLEE
ncbi:MAG: hypothetical protein ACYYK0_03470 [Candidatus Eutrophobiaceae bacterium]